MTMVAIGSDSAYPASEIPELEIQHMVTPTPFIPGGMKGTGEAGALAPAE